MATDFIPGLPSYLRQNQLIDQMGKFNAIPKHTDYEAQIRERIARENSTAPKAYQAPSAATSGNATIDQFMAAIKSQESGGSYGIVNRDSGALGAYQIMPFNLPGWSRAAGLNYTPTRSQFLNDPDMQELIARTQIQNYYNRYGDWGQVAATWYGGEGGRKRYITGGGTGQEAGGYPSIQSYVQQVLKRMNS